MVRATERMWGRWWDDVCKMVWTRRRVNRMKLTDWQWQTNFTKLWVDSVVGS